MDAALPASPADRLAALRRGELAGLRMLRLPGLGLTRLPPEILDLAPTLEVLDLSDNALTGLPPDFARLTRLRAVFLSGNPLRRLPAVLGDCPALSQIGCRGSGLVEVPPEALPPSLRWLTLTDNAIATLPPELGARPGLRKLLLAGNRLTALPEALQEAQGLELLRISANRLEALPDWLAALPALAWLGWAGNPLDRATPPPAPEIGWPALQTGELLGEGASGRVLRADWHRLGLPPLPVAAKLFRGAMTSDGLPERELAACLAAGAHPQLPGALGRLTGHPEGLQGLIMPLLPAGWRALAAPPSLESCSRDVYPPALQLAPATALRLARAAALAAQHLHGCGLLHGDLYAHNLLWDGESGDAVLSDFGAASFLQRDERHPQRWFALETRAWGLLLQELLAHCPALQGEAALQALAHDCSTGLPAGRPSLAAALAALPAD